MKKILIIISAIAVAAAAGIGVKRFTLNGKAAWASGDFK